MLKKQTRQNAKMLHFVTNNRPLCFNKTRRKTDCFAARAEAWHEVFSLNNFKDTFTFECYKIFFQTRSLQDVFVSSSYNLDGL